MSQRKYRLDVCPECKVREGVSSRKRVYECSYCERWFCKRHLEPRLVNIPDFKRIIKDVSWQNLIEKEWRRKDAHPDFQYTKEKWLELRWAKIEALLNGQRGYGKSVSVKPQRENKCQVCGKELDLPFRCSYCQDYFCVDHKLPENHQCRGLPKEPFWYPKRRKLAEATERRVDRCPKCGSGSIGVLSFDRERANLRCQICGYEWKQPRSDRKHQKLIPKETRPFVQSRSRKHKVGMTILAFFLVIILIVASLFLGGILEFNIGTPLNPPVEETTTSNVIVQGKISVFEDEGCTKPVQAIDWGKVESNQSYSQIIYMRNDNEEELLDWGKRDIVWQRENVNPSFVYISIKVNYGDTKIKPNEVRQATITLTVLGLLEDSDKLNPNADIPQFTFDLILKGQDLSPFTYAYIRTYANRDANNITVVYKDELKETVSVIIEIGIWKTMGSEQVMEVVWNSTKYVSEFIETWLGAYRYTNYQLIVTINHERYGKLEYRNYLIGQLG